MSLRLRARIGIATRLMITRACYRRLFESPDGQDVLKDLSRLGNMHKPTFSADPYTTAFEEGKRFMVLTILRKSGQDPQSLIDAVTQEQNEHP